MPFTLWSHGHIAVQTCAKLDLLTNFSGLSFFIKSHRDLLQKHSCDAHIWWMMLFSDATQPINLVEKRVGWPKTKKFFCWTNKNRTKIFSLVFWPTDPSSTRLIGCVASPNNTTYQMWNYQECFCSKSRRDSLRNQKSPTWPEWKHRTTVYWSQWCCGIGLVLYAVRRALYFVLCSFVLLLGGHYGLFPVACLWSATTHTPHRHGVTWGVSGWKIDRRRSGLFPVGCRGSFARVCSEVFLVGNFSRHVLYCFQSAAAVPAHKVWRA